VVEGQELVAASVAAMALRIRPIGLVVPTEGGGMPRRIARFRLPVRITAVTRLEATCQALQFVWGVDPVYQPERFRSWRAFARDRFKDRARGDPGSARILLTQDVETATATVSRLELIEL
jgi:pyruvate kinase